MCSSAAGAYQVDEDVVRGEYTIPRHLEYGFTIVNTSNVAAKNVEFWVYAPVSLTATQWCRKVESSHPFDIIRDGQGNQILHFTFDDMAPGGAKVVTIGADLMLSRDAQKLRVHDVAPYMGPVRYIESDDPEIIAVARQLTGADIIDVSRKIFSWTSKSIRYTGYSPEDRGALYTLRNRGGDCTEYAYLFVALCRANRIPARCMSGYVYQGNAVLNPSLFHNWAEFYHDGTWVLADPQMKVFMKDQSSYITFRVFGTPLDDTVGGFHRFKCTGGQSIQVTMNG